MPGLRQHIVLPHETLSGIGAKYGFRDWTLIFRAACNTELRKLRSRPEMIRPGDRLFIPPNPVEIRALLHRQLHELRKQRAETVSLFSNLDSGLQRGYEEYDRNARAIEVIAAVVGSLAVMISKGLQAINLTGAALEKINKDLTHAALELGYGTAFDVAIADKLPDIFAVGAPLADLGPLIDAASDITSPTFWARVLSELWNGSGWARAVSTSPEDTLQTLRSRARAQRDERIRDLDAIIKRTERRIGDVGSRPESLYQAN
jgi:hypothetical protein